MDALSRLLLLYPVHAALEVRCEFGAPWRLDENAAAAGVAPYHMVLTGQAWLAVGASAPRRIRAGDIVVLPQGTAHCLYTDPDAVALPVRESRNHAVRVVENLGGTETRESAEILCGQFRFEGESARGLLLGLPVALVIGTSQGEDRVGLRALMALLRSETTTARPGAGLVVAQLASALFALVMRAWLEQEEASTSPGLFGLLAETRLQPALAAMLAEPGAPWSLEALAQRCHMSRATLARVFRQAAGTTPGEVLQRIRMAQAARHLVQGSDSVASIAEAAGYQSEAAFHRAFKRGFGVGPGSYRRQARMETRQA
jgi:AraC family transcriptional activator of mtrCDE